MIVDTSALLAYFDANEPRHTDVARIIENTDAPLIVSPYVIAELDYLVLTRHGSDAELVVLDELTSGAWELADMTSARIRVATEIVRRYADQPIGLTDASNIVLADAYRTRQIATLDRRHFEVLRFDDHTAIEILP
ncbi:PIN domain-containing protein [Microbacterium schleiferi]|uniref:Ribonuclease VapC n=1 Tax=Microbacterium schleiferi TaxID=69362 RepID=A0A7S8MXH8_9MICO|nr:PIN domain-containing protein [Microbacterium schleiferi]QPE04985.1 PIN domain-containing protein [Microbacterium schleiferi]